jgi:hypothetical protein
LKAHPGEIDHASEVLQSAEGVKHIPAMPGAGGTQFLAIKEAEQNSRPGRTA